MTQQKQDTNAGYVRQQGLPSWAERAVVYTGVDVEVCDFIGCAHNPTWCLRGEQPCFYMCWRHFGNHDGLALAAAQALKAKEVVK